MLEQPTRTPCSGMQERLKLLQAAGVDDATVMEPTLVWKWLVIEIV